MNYPRKRRTYICRFWNASPIRLSAINEAQARYMAEGVAKKHGFKIQSIGLHRA